MTQTKLLIHPEELSRAWISRAAALGVNVLGLHPVGGRHARESLNDLLEKLKTEEFTALLDEAAEAGLSIEYDLHAGSFLAPRELFGAHPDWFRENENGERTDDHNFCPSSEEMLEIVANRAADLAKSLYRSTHRYAFWLDDAKHGDCHCAKCRTLSPSDQQLIVANRMLSGIRRVDPDATLSYLAYFRCIEPPKAVRPSKGIFLEYAPFEKRLDLPADKQSIGAELDALQTCFPAEETEILEYWYDNSMFSDWKKPPKRFFPANDLIQRDLAFYRSRGVETIASFACYFGADYTEQFGEPDLSAFSAVNA